MKKFFSTKETYIAIALGAALLFAILWFMGKYPGSPKFGATYVKMPDAATLPPADSNATAV